MSCCGWPASGGGGGGGIGGGGAAGQVAYFTDPVTLASSPNFAWDGLTLDLNVGDNLAGAFRVRQGTAEYLKVVTTNGAESIEVGNAVTNPVVNFPGSGAHNFTGDVNLVGKLRTSFSGVGINAGILVQSANPALAIRETDAGGDNRLWDLTGDGGVLKLRAVNDASTIFVDLMTVSRSGVASAEVTFPRALTWFGSGIGGAVALINGGAGASRDIQFLTAGNNRWNLRVNNAPETGGNAGSNFALQAFADGGGIIDEVLLINRAAGGTMTVSRPTTFNSTAFINGVLSLNTVSGGGTRMLVTDNGGNISAQAIPGGVSGSGTANQLAFWSAATALTGSAAITQSGGNLVLTGQILSSSAGAGSNAGLYLSSNQPAVGFNNPSAAANNRRSTIWITGTQIEWLLQNDSNAGTPWLSVSRSANVASLVALTSTALTQSGTLAVTGLTTLSNDLAFTGAGATIRTDTSPGTDNKRLFINGGGNGGNTRGGQILFYGNNFAADGGSLSLEAGNVGTGQIFFQTGGAGRARFTNAGQFQIGDIASAVTNSAMLDVRGPGSLQVAAAFGTAATVDSTWPGLIYITTSGTINAGLNVDAAGVELRINQFGFANGTTRGRDFAVFDGQGTRRFSLSGTNGHVAIGTGTAGATHGLEVTTAGTIRFADLTGSGSRYVKCDATGILSSSPTLLADQAGSGINSGLLAESTLPFAAWHETGALVNQGWWAMGAQANQFRFVAVNDAGTVANDIFTVDRAAALPLAVRFTPQVIAGAVGADLESAFVSESLQPSYALHETGQPVDQGWWDFSANASRLRFRAVDDTGGAASNFMTVDRVGSNIDLIRLVGPVQTTERLTTAAATAARAGLVIPHGVAPAAPVDGAMWTTAAGAFIRIGGVTRQFTLV